MDHPIGNLMQTTLENIKDMVDVNTVVGDAIAASNGSTIIPISRVSFGFVAGGGDYGKKPEEMASLFQEVDVLVFDMQETGTRFYTYLYTMADAMKAPGIGIAPLPRCLKY